MIEIGKNFNALTGKPLSCKAWNDHAKDLKVPQLNRKNFRFETFDHFLELCGVEKVDGRKLRRIKRVKVQCCICGQKVEVKVNDKRVLSNTEVWCSKQCGYVLLGRKVSKALKGRPSVHKGNPAFNARMKEVSNTPEQRKYKALAGKQKAINLVHRICEFLSKYQIEPTPENWENSASAFKQETGSYHYIHAQKAAELVGGWDEIKKLVSKQNHRVVSVEADGLDDIYNLSVDEGHNYAVITSVTGDDLKMADFSGIILRSHCSQL